MGDRPNHLAPYADPLDAYSPPPPMAGAPPPVSPPPSRLVSSPIMDLEFHNSLSTPRPTLGPPAPFRGGDSLVDRMFLGALRYLEPYGGTPGRWFNQAVQHGRTAPFTEADLSHGDADAIRTIVQAHARRTGAREGQIMPHYPSSDYDATRNPNALNLRSALGGFRYSIADDGTIHVNDTYDFNVDRGPRSHDMGALGKLSAIALGPVAYGASIGRSVLGDDSGRGIPVRLVIPPPVPFEDYTNTPPPVGVPVPRSNLLRTYGLLNDLGIEGESVGVGAGLGVIEAPRP